MPRRVGKFIESGIRRLLSRRLGKAAHAAWRDGDIGRAVRTYERAIAVNRKDVESMGELAALYLGFGRHDEALSLLQTALRLDPSIPGLHVNLGNLRLMQGNFPDAIDAYHHALNLDRSNYSAYGNCFRAHMEMCDWAGFEKHFQGLLDLRQAGDPTWVNRISAYMSLLVPLDRGAQLEVAKHAARDYEVAPGRAWADTALRSPGARLRVGYLSCDFHDHATMHLAAGLFGKHDRSRVEVFAYSMGQESSSPLVDRVRVGCDKFRDIANLSALEAAQLIRRDGIDILVDMKGYTGGSRPEISAMRPAPIQVSFLGYPGTMGARFIDYIVADKEVIPEAHFGDYTERVIWMPNSYQVTDNEQPISAVKRSRADCGLPDAEFVFCSFNQSYKIDRRTFNCWMRILHRVPRSVLWLMANNPFAVARLSAAAAMAGVAPARLIFARPEDKTHHLARLGLADLMLDTFVVNAHTTTTDALWAGLPVLTLQGDTFASRVAASVLPACGTEQTVCKTEGEYEDAAVALATDNGRLGAIRSQLKDRASTRLFDTDNYVSDLENAFDIIGGLRNAGEQPRHVAVTTI